MVAALATHGITCQVDSCGTEGYHVGEPPDERSQLHARRRGYELSTQRARQLSDQDFVRFTHILAMDRQHLAALKRRCPPEHQHKLALFLQVSTLDRNGDVPDPYYGGKAGFERVLDLIEEGCESWIRVWQAQA